MFVLSLKVPFKGLCHLLMEVLLFWDPQVNMDVVSHH